jgi:hypothetical protein
MSVCWSKGKQKQFCYLQLLCWYVATIWEIHSLQFLCQYPATIWDPATIYSSCPSILATILDLVTVYSSVLDFRYYLRHKHYLQFLNYYPPTIWNSATISVPVPLYNSSPCMQTFMVCSFERLVLSLQETYHSSSLNSVKVFAYFEDSKKKMNLKSCLLYVHLWII